MMTDKRHSPNDVEKRIAHFLLLALSWAACRHSYEFRNVQGDLSHAFLYGTSNCLPAPLP